MAVWAEPWAGAEDCFAEGVGEAADAQAVTRVVRTATNATTRVAAGEEEVMARSLERDGYQRFVAPAASGPCKHIAQPDRIAEYRGIRIIRLFARAGGRDALAAVPRRHTRRIRTPRSSR